MGRTTPSIGRPPPDLDRPPPRRRTANPVRPRTWPSAVQASGRPIRSAPNLAVRRPGQRTAVRGGRPWRTATCGRHAADGRPPFLYFFSPSPSLLISFPLSLRPLPFLILFDSTR